MLNRLDRESRWQRLELYFVVRKVGDGQERPSDISSNFVTHGSALLGIVAASDKREDLNLEACIDTSLNGVPWVYLSLDLTFRVRQPVCRMLCVGFEF